MSDEERPKKGKGGRKPGKSHTERLAYELGNLIRSGEWPPGHKLPTQKALGKEYSLSVDVIQPMLGRLEAEGLITKGPGRRAVVANPEPICVLEIDLHPAPAAASTAWLSEPALLFKSGREKGSPRWRYATATAAPSNRIAGLLELEADEVMVVRTMTQTVGGEALVVWTSYLPDELAVDGDLWKSVKPGQLALPGHPATVRPYDKRCWMPDPEERKAFGVGLGVPVEFYAWPHWVPAGERVLRAGLTVAARCDRVVVRPRCGCQPEQRA